MNAKRLEGLSLGWYNTHVKRSGATYTILNVLMKRRSSRKSLMNHSDERGRKVCSHDVWEAKKRHLIYESGGRFGITADGIALLLAAKLRLRPVSLLILCLVYGQINRCGMYVRSRDRLLHVYCAFLTEPVFQARFSELIHDGWLKRKDGIRWSIPRVEELTQYRDILLAIDVTMFKLSRSTPITRLIRSAM